MPRSVVDFARLTTADLPRDAPDPRYSTALQPAHVSAASIAVRTHTEAPGTLRAKRASLETRCFGSPRLSRAPRREAPCLPHPARQFHRYSDGLVAQEDDLGADVA